MGLRLIQNKVWIGIMRSLRRFLFCFFLLLFHVQPAYAAHIGDGVAVRRSSNYTCGSGGWCTIPWDVEDFDDAAFHSTVSNTDRLTVPSGGDGWYTITGQLYVYMNAAAYMNLRVVHGSTERCREYDYAASNGYFFISTTCLWKASEADYFTLQFYQASGADAIIQSSFSAFKMVYHSGSPAEIAGCHIEMGGGVTDHDVLRYVSDNGSCTWEVESISTDMIPAHAITHQDGGSDEINVTALSGLLADPQDAGWFHGLAITVTGVTDGQVLAWNAAETEWQPTVISGGIMDVITATISGTVPVVITNTWHYSQTLSSGHDIAVIRSFSYGEASIAIALFSLLALFGARWIFELVRR